MSLRLAVIAGVLLTSLTHFSNVSAQSRFDTWTIDNGLPQNSVRSILQTRDGYLWFTTLNGLVRFDGLRFTVFNKNNTPALQSNRLLDLYEDTEGTLWIEAEDFRVAKYSHGTFTEFTRNDKLKWEEQFSSREGAKPPPWVLNRSHIYLKGGPTAPPKALTPVDERDIVRLDKSYWGIFPGNGGLIVYSNGHPTTYTIKDGLSSSKITKIYRDTKGVIWIGTEDGGLNRFQNGKFTVYGVKDGLPSEYIQFKAAYEDQKGGIWIALYNGELYRLKNGVRLSLTADRPSKSLVESIYEDQEGSIWIGTSSAGISRWREYSVNVLSKIDGLFSDNTYPILEDRSGVVWIGTWPGLNQYRDEKFIHLPNIDGEPYGTVASLYEDSEGALWIGTYGSGVRKYKDGRYLLKSIPGLTGKEANGVLAITQDNSRTFWFGTTSGLFAYKDGVLKHLTTVDGLPHQHVNAILKGRDGELWLGTLGGVARLKDGKFITYTEREGLSANNVRSLFQDANGALWIGTYDGGLNRLKDGRLIRYTMDEGMFDNGVFQIVEDAHANFWMSSNRGIYRVSRQDLEDFAAGKISSITSVGYGRSDGMLNAECNGGVQPAGIKSRDGRLWFPTQQGVAVIDPEAIKVNSHPPSVLIEEFSLDDRKIPFAGGVRVLPGQKRFEIRYTAPSYIKPEQVRFKYKLEGLEDDWIDAGTRRTSNYSYVPPGSYNFRVIAANSDGVWNMEGASLPIVVQPPFWRTWWFLTLSTLGIVAALAWGYKFRIRQMEREKEAQQAFSRQLIASQEIERKRIAGELHDSLGQNLLVIKTRAQIGMMRPEDAANAVAQFGEISSVVSQSIQEVRQISSNLHPYQLDQLGLTTAITAMIGRVSDAAGLDISMEIDNIDGLFNTASEINIYRIVQECLNNIVKHSAASRAAVMIKRAPQKVTITVSDNGKGFSLSAVKSGFGLTGMAERARMLDGVHIVESTPDKGTKITLVIESTEK